MKQTHIKIWPWKDAPKKYRVLSQHGGDEDWVVFVPNPIRLRHWHPFIDIGVNEDEWLSGWGWGSGHEVDNGLIIIFAHA